MVRLSYLYKVSWSNFDASDSREFTSEERMSKKDFQILIKRLLNRAAEEIAGKKETFIGGAELMVMVWKLLEGEGFKPVTYVDNFDLYAATIIDDQDKDQYKEYLYIESFKQIVEHNKKVWDTV